MGKICVFFGHRDVGESVKETLMERVEQAIIQDGVTEFWNGGYGGFDHLAANAVHEIKRRYPDILHCRVYAYPPNNSRIPERFDRAFCPDYLSEFPDKWRIPRRNIWMAQQCDMAITYVNHAESRIYEPLDWMLTAHKPFYNLGIYQPTPYVPFKSLLYEEES